MKYTLVLLTLFLVFASSCGNKKAIHYLQDIKEYQPLAEPLINRRFIKESDILRILVSALDEETVRPYNNNFDQNQTSNHLDGYLVSNKGTINFPVFGNIYVLGLTTEQVSEILRDKITEHVNNPVVSVRISNFKITILGEVNSPGTFYINDERVTLLEAIGRAGDLNIFGIREVLILREENGVQTSAFVDIRKSEFLNSPYYYLQQNDVIYVKPNSPQTNTAVLKNSGIYFSVISLLTSITILYITFR